MSAICDCITGVNCDACPATLVMRNMSAACCGRHASLYAYANARDHPDERLVFSGLPSLYNGWAPGVATREPHLYF